ncbi:MAG: hypothetical protein LBD13_04280 [Spirochaetaceae bacterium]|jgi:hypothetical protein|nr:hypothetical protein [Spirochaetaceae bacterium]
MRVADESIARAVLNVLRAPSLRSAGFRCAASIFSHFFALQYGAALFPGRIPVSKADHPLDAAIPFTPRWVAVYLDFIHFWVRCLGFLLRTYRQAVFSLARDFIGAVTEIYRLAGRVYRKNLSTTSRPRRIANCRFLLIYLFDPHLMCIPSLHVLMVILTYTRFRDIVQAMGDEARFASLIEEVRQQALRITESVLYVKQHSINCVAASLYMMTRLNPRLFPQEEARRFVSELFIHQSPPCAVDRERIAGYIQELYSRFLAEGNAGSWEAPLLAFLASKRGAAPEPSP